MAKFVPLQKNKHADKKWKPPVNFAFAAKEALIPIVGMEVAIAAVNMALVFVRHEGALQLAAISGPPQSADNFFVGRDGRWLGTYIPGILRAYPFRLTRLEGRDEMALCIASDAVGDEGQPLYDAATDDLAGPVRNNLNMLEMYEKSRLHTVHAAAALEQAGVLAEWPIKFKGPKGAEISATGLMRVDEKALSELDDATYLKLRKIGALPMAYAQIISMSRLGALAQLAQLRERLSAASRQQQPAQGKAPNLDFLRVEDGTLVF
ncbi:MAG: SapC family protein [Rhizobiaceae bacterium]|nr:SapC family protein [Rhizobiaceae bacterium]